MSAPMCSVPTKNGDVEVPVGTLIWLDGEFPALADKGGYQTVRSRLGDGNPFRYGNRIAVIIAIPDGRGGWTMLDATTPDATTPEWVPLAPEQVALLPDRTSVRVEWGGVVTEGPLHREQTRGGEVSLYHSGSHGWWIGRLPNVTVWVHPEDVPDPLADLIERAARTLSEMATLKWDTLSEDSRELYRDRARTVLAVFRGEQA